MTGQGHAGGAGTLVNAFATGNGATFGLGYHVTARVASSRAFRVWSNGRRLPEAEARLAVESARAIQQKLAAPEPLDIHVESDIPPRRGLKSSSAVSVAVVQAVAQHAGRRAPDAQLLDAAADAGLRSRTSLTGAYDDASACLLGGVVLTDNRARRIRRRARLPRGLVALVRVPRKTLATGSLRRATFRPIGPVIARAWQLAFDGHYREAMLLNTLAYAPLLGHTPTFSMRAIARGAYAAGLSGKGPAEIALVESEEVPRFRRDPLLAKAQVVDLNGRGAA